MAGRRLSHDRQVFAFALLAAVPALLTMTILLAAGDYSARVRWTLGLVVVGCWLGFAAAARNRVVRSLQTVGNLLSALREGDFSIRGRGATRLDPLGDVMAEINILGRTLQSQRLGAVEATALLRTAMEVIDVAIFAFDAGDRLRLVNPAGQRLLCAPAEDLLGRAAREIGLAELLRGEDERVLENVRFPGADARARWSLRRSSFREDGRPHTLVVVADVSQALREEELKAWQRLVRVLGHELNNSLAPIKSIAGSLTRLLEQRPHDAEWENDMHSGLAVVGARAESLARFVEAYARLTKLPPPQLMPTAVGPLVHRVASLEVRQPVQVRDGPEVSVAIDAAQIEQVLINLVTNAVDAAGHTGGDVLVTWRTRDDAVEIDVEDEGPGIANRANLFVPFFTTKEKGSGIGLVLSRQIAENHHGSVTLENRPAGRSGCIARLRLPA